MHSLIRKFFRGRGVSQKIVLEKNGAIRASGATNQIKNPFFGGLKSVNSGTGAHNQPIHRNPGTVDSIQKRLAGKKSDVVFLLKNIIRAVKGFLIGSRCAQPGVGGKIKINVSFGVLGQKLKNVLFAFRNDIKNVFYPLSRNPIPKQVGNGTYEYFLGLFSIDGLKKSIGMKLRLERAPESFVHRPGIAVRAIVETPRYWIPGKIGPINLCIIHDPNILQYFLFSKKN